MSFMEFIELAKKRYSVRSYQEKKVEEEKLMKILEAGRVAPTGANFQPQRLLVIREEAGLEKLKNSANVFGAPIAIVVCGEKDEAWKRPYDNKNIVDIDTSIVADHMMMQATELGLGTIWVCYLKPDVLKKDFNLPKGVEPISILGLGYADGEPTSPDRHNKARKPLKDTVVYETF
jgi:nitroreductase